MNTQENITEKLTEGLDPMHLEVINESHMHNVPPGSESHFKVVVVAEAFAGDRLIARHRKVNGLLAEELRSQIHALALHTMTPQEWFDKAGTAAESPQCMGGSNAD